MINFVGKKKYYYTVSGILISISLLALAFFGIRFSIDFTGGSQFSFTTEGSEERIEGIIESYDVNVASTTYEGDLFVVRTEELNQQKRSEIESDIEENLQDTRLDEFQTIGPIIGGETKTKAVQSILLAVAAILLYIAIVFRHVSRPLASWKYGVAAIAALIHDVLITIGLFSILGWLLRVEIDPLFITALLTVMGFSVHDTIVTFDRIRENLKNNVKNIAYEKVVNNSIIETLTRSLNTSVTVLFVLVALLIFGGDTIRWFVAALTIGIMAGTYSSIFIASQILVTWNERDKRKKRKGEE